MKFCSFACEESDSGQAQHAACLAVNGVHCNILGHVVEKGQPCPVEEAFHQRREKAAKKRKK